MDSLKKYVLVTGASTGIGEACTRYLAENGLIVFAGVRSEFAGHNLQQENPEFIRPLMLDVTQADMIEQARQVIEQEVGEAGLYALINNAGVAIGGPLEFVTIDEFRKQLEVNVIGQVAVAQAFIPLLRQGKGRIVNIGSISGRSVTPFLGPYSASKHAMEALSDALRMELLPWGISVSLIEPGSIRTPIWKKSLSYAEVMRQSLPSHAEALYGQALSVMMERTSQSEAKSSPVESVVKAVSHALLSENPQTRYLVGNDAKLRLILNILPDRWRDWLVIKAIGLNQ
jgi:NAD(P)-dependent dehydrogenase (short-subunit alcohol dehydrogenase family)